MCGITGISHIRGPGKISLETLGQMTEMLRHRGPDESGIYIDDQTGLGSSRLSIIDLTSGTQPIHNENKTLWMVLNGEIFNYPALRKELQSEGHRFYTSTDTEVALHLYERDSVHCLKRLNGQFAMAIWNTVKKELFIARDRIGICPLHYTVNNGCLYFASEIKSLFVTPKISREINPIALDQIATFWTTLPGYTGFKNINELPPGGYLRLCDGQLSIQKYWDFPLRSKKDRNDSLPEEICEHLHALLSDAVKIRLQADVPVGSYLSGGLDSSSITAIVASQFNKQIQTFGIRFKEPDFDESIHQHHMAEFLDVRHHELMVSNNDIAENFASTLWHTEKPTLRTASTPLFLLSKRVSESGVKVILTGEGADEIFGGYDIFKEALIRKFWARQPDSKTRANLITRIYPDVFTTPALKNSFIAFFGQGLDAADDPLFSHLIRWNNTKRIKTFFSDDLKNEIGSYEGIDEMRQLLPENFNSGGCLARAQYLESKLLLSNYLLSSQGDRVAMAHSVETRPPYLDHRLIECMARVPSVWKILGLNEKFILKKTFLDLLPEEILSRPKKPFRAPIHASLLAPSLPEEIQQALAEKTIRNNGYFHPKKTAMLIKKLKSKTPLNEVEGMALAAIVSTQLIDSQFVKNFPMSVSRYFKPDLLADFRAHKRRILCRDKLRGFHEQEHPLS
ncbi:MAG: asparagine synthase (glutamine-hydrolyzing) [Desulfobacteraceae bacterium]|nr:MAG: asparagine synthase (glutamine-hydrolyzing) [Desulfobacteraceae bacterium]